MSRLDVVPLAQFDRTGGHVIITAGWGDGRGHKGVDLGTTDGIEIGTPVYAPVAGTVVALLNDGPFVPPNHHTAGINLHLLGDRGQRFKFFHLNRSVVVPGQWVGVGQQIAEVGRTGTIAPHLHLEEHFGNFSNPIDCTADVANAINRGRWPGVPDAPAAPTPPTPPPITTEGITMAGRFWSRSGTVSYVGVDRGGLYRVDYATPAALELSADEAFENVTDALAPTFDAIPVTATAA